jgi:hypothetical protein
MNKLSSLACVVFCIFLLLLLLSNAVAQTANPTWKIQVVDSNGSISRYSSLALDSNGNPHISYCRLHEKYTDLNDDLMYASLVGSEWQIQTVKKNGAIDGSGSLALDSAGNPHICYIDENHDLMYASWNGTGWGLQKADQNSTTPGGHYLVLDSNDNPHIIYYNSTDYSLKYAAWTGNEWNVQIIDQETIESSGRNQTGCPSLAVDSNGNPHISYYYTFTNQNLGDWESDLIYALWNGTGWQKQIIEKMGNVGSFDVYTSIALDSRDYPHICYQTGVPTVLKYVSWTGRNWSLQTVDKIGGGFFNSLSLDSRDNPQISYYYPINGSLMLAIWSGSNWDIQVVTTLNSVAYYPSLVVDSIGNPHISFGTIGNSLRYASAVLPPAETGRHITAQYLYAVIVGVVVVVVVGAVLLLLRKRRVKKSKIDSSNNLPQTMSS